MLLQEMVLLIKKMPSPETKQLLELIWLEIKYLSIATTPGSFHIPIVAQVKNMEREAVVALGSLIVVSER